MPNGRGDHLGWVELRLPRHLPEDLPCGRLQPRDRVSGPHDQLLNAASADNNGRTVGGPIRKFAPAQFAAHPIQGHNARVWLAADANDEKVTHNQWCRARTVAWNLTEQICNHML